jgi:hypothetical protein
MSLNNLAKIMKCAGNDDIVTMKADDNGDTITFMFESPSEPQAVLKARASARHRPLGAHARPPRAHDRAPQPAAPQRRTGCRTLSSN